MPTALLTVSLAHLLAPLSRRRTTQDSLPTLDAAMSAVRPACEEDAIHGVKEEQTEMKQYNAVKLIKTGNL